MIRKLRIKFIVVTMLMMTILFAVFFTLYKMNNNYWYHIDVLNTLEWIADSDVFTNGKATKNNDLVKEVNSEDDQPIIGVITNSDGKILSQQNIGKYKNKVVKQREINDILLQKNTRYRYNGYVYIVKKIDGNRQLILLQDISAKGQVVKRYLRTGLIIFVGFIMLTLIVIFISRFITESTKKSLEREKQFISDASHELKTPVSAISINAQALKTDLENIHLNNILSETNRLNRLIEKLLSLARLEEIPTKDTEKCSLTDIVDEISLTYESVAYDKKINYKFEVKDNITIDGDIDELKQLVAILIDNAIKNAEVLGLVSIVLYRSGRHAVLKVINTGKGISDKDLPYIFERFYTSKDSRSDDSYGLGLSIAKIIVERHKGTIEVESIPNKETVFTVKF